jgi:solute carrier family 25 (mitochondrial carnitine/acylcarnitine transporter), member 20/29
MTYNRSLKTLDPSITDPTKLHHVGLSKIWSAGAVGGLASWVVSAPSELIKCRTQLYEVSKMNSWITFMHVWQHHGVRGLYLGGVTTMFRDSVGYGFYFSSYELCRHAFASRRTTPESNAADFDILASGGIAGIITWASIYPLDVIKTRIQAEGWHLGQSHQNPWSRGNAMAIARSTFTNEGFAAFYRGLVVCSVRAFFVNAVQVFLIFPNSFRMLTVCSGTPMKS